MRFPWMGVIFWVGVFGWFSFIVWTRYLREQERWKTLRAFAERGQQLDAETLERLFPQSSLRPDQRPDSPESVSRGLMVGGLVTAFAAVGLLIAGQLFFSQIADEARWAMSGAGAIAGMVGLGLLTASFLLRRQAAADGRKHIEPVDDNR